MNTTLRRFVGFALTLLSIAAPAGALAAEPSTAPPATSRNHAARMRVRADSSPATSVTFPDSPEGRAVAAWFHGFNGTEAEMRAVWENHFAPAPRPIEARLARWREMREQAGSLTPVRVGDANGGLRVFARDAQGLMLRMDFEFEGDSHKLAGVRLEQVEGGEEAAEDSGPTTPLAEAQVADTIAAHVAKLAGEGRFAGVVRVERGGHVLLERAYGPADREAHAENRTDTRFNIGSINKLFTKTVIAKLIEQGKLAPEDKLSKHLRDFPRDKADRITIQQLLDMKSGLGDFFGPRYDAADKSKLKNPRDWFPLFAADTLEFEPGTQSRYSNAGYDVLGAVAEAVTGRSYYDLVREIVYGPAGMTSSDSYAKDETIENKALGYTSEGARDGLRRNDDRLPGRGSPAGGGYSTAADLSRFVSALAAGKLVAPETLERFFGARAVPGGGMELGMGFAGGTEGVNAVVENMEGWRVIVLANLDPPAAESLARWIRGAIRRVRS